MAKLPDDMVQKAKQLDLLTYLRAYEPHELVHVSGNVFCTKSHDSLKISRGMWYWWSRNIGGKTALDYLIKVKGMNFREAVVLLSGRPLPEDILTLKSNYEYKREIPPAAFQLPEKNETTHVIEKYLVGRGIDLEIVRDCIDQGLIFESRNYHNVVFVGKNEQKKPVYATFRAANKSKIRGDIGGSDKRFSFRLAAGQCGKVHVFEAAIDVLSYATLMKMAGMDWKSEPLLSLSGIFLPKGNGEIAMPPALEQYIYQYPDVKKIVLHMDNDVAGHKFAAAIARKLMKNYEVATGFPSIGKDINDYLCIKKGILNLEKQLPEPAGREKI